MTPAATEQARDATTTVIPEAKPPRVWGARPRDLHDLLWASRCIQPVRPGHGSASVAKGPALYLLLDESQIVLLPIGRVLKKMHWASPKAVRIRLAVRDASEYKESVAEGDRGLRFVRSYGRAVRRSERVWMTADPDLAEIWAEAGSRAEATRALREKVRSADLLSLSLEGFSSETDAHHTHDWLAGALSQWTRPNAVIPDVFEYQPGVWIHEQSRIDPGVRFIGSAWIGAGVEIDAGTVVVGPVILEDGSDANPDPVPAPDEIDWDLARSHRWSLPSLIQGGSFRRVAKRAFDIVFSLCVILATLPIYIPIMIAIVLEDGRPFFFAHRRQTLGGREFPCFKFRTMRKNAEEIKAQLVAQNAADGPQFFMENDPRVTRVGRILRKYQLDEFPQFFNVLAGHMSVVGPRPSPEKENQYCPTWREARLSVRPGVTGLWQVSRTREPQTDFQEWIRYDLEYVQHQSFVGDLRIIFETVRGIVK